MEIPELINFIKKYSLFIIIGGLVCSTVGVAVYYFYPPRYQAVGYIYVVRQLNSEATQPTLPNEFTYEGFYAQQNAQQFTPTVIGVLESDTLKRSVLEKQGTPVTTENLRVFSKALKVKKKTPQLVEVVLKTASPEMSEALWKDTLTSLTESIQPLTAAGDSQLVIAPLSQDPVIKETYRSWRLNSVVGFVLGVLLVTVLCAVIDGIGINKKSSGKR